MQFRLGEPEVPRFVIAIRVKRSPPRWVVGIIAPRLRTGPDYVAPRNWQWNAGDGIFLGGGTIAWPAGSANIGVTCRPAQPCPVGWLTQPSHGFADGNGYSRAQVPAGPNSGYWYVSSVSMNVHMVPLVNPDMLPGGAEYAVTGSDAVACGASSADTVTVSFTDYNEQCRYSENYLVPFETWAWDHETEHMANVADVVPGHDLWDARRVLESVVAAGAGDLDDWAALALNDIPMCVQQTGANHSIGSFPGLPTEVWFLYPTPSPHFNSLPQGSKWWSPSAYTAPCV